MAEDELDRWGRIMNKRGHASMFARETHEDLKIVERSAASEFAHSMLAEFGVKLKNIRSSNDDPPDCLASLDGQDIHIEMTELVDGEIIAEVQRARKKGQAINSYHGQLFQRSQWNDERLVGWLRGLVERKDSKYKSSGVSVDALVIYTDEPWLGPVQVRDWLADWPFARPETIRSAFLLMTYSPGFARHWPLFRLFGSFWDDS